MADKTVSRINVGFVRLKRLNQSLFCLICSQTVLVTAAAGALGLATVDLAANALGAKVCS